MALEPHAQPTVLLLGGGYTLQRVATLLPAKTFVITSRSEVTCAAWRAREWYAHPVSLSDPASIRDLFSLYPGITTIVDSVPPLREGDPTHGVQNLCKALSSTHVRRLVYLSTTGVFGGRDGQVVDEQTPPRPWNAQGQARWDSELVYQGYVDAHRETQFVALRLPAIYGEDRGLVHSIRSGTYRLIDDGSQWTNRIHVDDLAQVIAACIQFQGVVPRVLCVSDDVPAQAQDVVAFVCAAEGVARPQSISSHEALQRGLYTMLSNQRVVNTCMKSLFGISLRYPSYREGLYAGRRGA
jgi:dTDP-4-dehydrorhamnose reductase